MMQSELYQSVLNKLSKIPVEYLKEVDKFLSKLTTKTKLKESKKEQILKFAGSWSDMADEDFDDMIKHMKETRNDWTERDLEL